VITVDEQSVLTLSQIQSVAGLDGAGLQALLDQGLACAQALQSIWQAMVQGKGQAQADSDLAAQSGAGFLRA
jgi:hypothetical protein